MKDSFAALARVEKELKKKDITLVEYGEIFNLRLGYPAVIIVATLLPTIVTRLYTNYSHLDI